MLESRQVLFLIPALQASMRVLLVPSTASAFLSLFHQGNGCLSGRNCFFGLMWVTTSVSTLLSCHQSQTLGFSKGKRQVYSHVLSLSSWVIESAAVKGKKVWETKVVLSKERWMFSPVKGLFLLYHIFSPLFWPTLSILLTQSRFLYRSRYKTSGAEWKLFS